MEISAMTSRPSSCDAQFGRLVFATVLMIALFDSPAVSAQDSEASGVSVARIAPGFFLLSEPTANMILFIGEDACLVAGIHKPSLVAKAMTTIRTLRGPQVRWALIMEDDQSPEYGDGGWGRAGAITLAHEALIQRMRQLVRVEKTIEGPVLATRNDLPVVGFSHVLQLFIKGQETHIIRERSGYTNADVIVHFEDSGILYLGNSYTSDGYPRIDLSRGGALEGLIDTAEWFVGGFPNPAMIEPIVPGRGPIATMQDLRDYRDMLVTVRDRVQALEQAGESIQRVLAAKPSAEFDAKWGHGPVTPDEFVAIVYESITKIKVLQKAQP